MTHAAMTDAALLFCLVLMTLLLVTFIGAVIVAPAAPPGSAAQAAGQALPHPGPPTPAPPQPRAPVSPPPLPRRWPLATSTMAGTPGWPDTDPAPSARCQYPTNQASRRRPAARPGAQRPSHPAPTPGTLVTSRPDGANGRRRRRCLCPKGGPPAARRQRAHKRPLAPKPGIPGTAGGTDQRQRKPARQPRHNIPGLSEQPV
jgi:hypothetical protein